MKFSGPVWVRLNHLLDEALDLEPAQRRAWIDSLAAEDAPLRETLADLLIRNGGPETRDVLSRAPLFISAQTPCLAAGDIVGPYRLVRQIGEGGMATVWLAERADGTLQRRVALKLPRVSLIDHELASRLNRERDILASLEHPGIARLYDAGVDLSGRPFLAIEYVDGVPLDVFASSRNLSIPRRLALFVQVASAIAHAHSHLVVHRDLKPSNILVNGSGDVRLLDFGIAQLLQSSPLDAYSSIRAFTPRYAAPEQFEGSGATVATDVYSLGVILYELLSGKSPYPCQPIDNGAGGREILSLGAMPLLDALDPDASRLVRGDLDAIVARAMQLRPEDRYATVGELIDDIRRHQRMLPVRAHDDSAMYRTGKFVRRHRAIVALGAALFVAIMVGSVAALWQAKLALSERDHSLRLFQEAEASNEFWNMVLTEGMEFDEPISINRLLERSEEMAEKTFAGSPVQYGVAMDAIAAMYMSYGKEVKAHTVTAKGLERVQGLGGDTRRAASLQCSYAVAIGKLGRVQEADGILSRTIADLAGEPGLQQYCLRCRFYVAHYDNDAVNALRYIEQAYRLSEKVPAVSITRSAGLMNDLASAYLINGKPDLAERYYAESMQLLERGGRQESRAAFGALKGWATLATYTGNPAGTLERLDRAIALQAEFSPDVVPDPDLTGNRANALALLGRFDEALAEYDRMRTRAGEFWGGGSFVYAMSGMADAYLSLGDVRQAQATLDRLEEGIKERPSDGSAAGLRLMMVKGRLLLQQGQLAAANDMFDAVIARFDSSSLVIASRARAFTDRARLLLKRDQVSAALADSRRALEIATAARMKDGYSNMLGLSALVHGEVLLRQGDRAGAAEALRIAESNLRNTVGSDHPDTRRVVELLRSLPPMA